MNDVTTPQRDERFGEIVEATTTEFTTQCYRLYEAPALGGLVRCGDDSPVYGIVYEVATHSMDPGRHPIARGQDEETEEGVYTSNPQLTRLLLTGFRSLVVGHRSGGEVRRYLSPVPPRIHSFVHGCAGDDLKEFSSSLDFVPLLFAAPGSATDDVIASFVRQASAVHTDPELYLLGAGKELATLLGDQVQRLNAILRRISP